MYNQLTDSSCTGHGDELPLSKKRRKTPTFRVWGYTDEATAIWQKAGHKYDIEIPMPIEARLVERKDGKGTLWAAIIPEVEF
jgi:hypothetical protein